MSEKRDDEPFVGRYVKETGYAFGKPPLKMPGAPPSTLPDGSHPSLPPPKILSEEQLDDLVKRMQVAAAAAPSNESEPLSCEACGGAASLCNEECRCGDTHHYCACACHLRQERWAIATARVEARRERERARLAALTEHELHSEQRHPDYEYLTTENARKQPGGEPPDNEGWEPNEIVLITNGIHGPDDPPRYRNWERFEFTETNYWRRRKPVEGQA